jgi:hypothetical protein
MELEPPKSFVESQFVVGKTPSQRRFLVQSDDQTRHSFDILSKAVHK